VGRIHAVRDPLIRAVRSRSELEGLAVFKRCIGVGASRAHADEIPGCDREIPPNLGLDVFVCGQQMSPNDVEPFFPERMNVVAPKAGGFGEKLDVREKPEVVPIDNLSKFS